MTPKIMNMPENNNNFTTKIPEREMYYFVL